MLLSAVSVLALALMPSAHAQDADSPTVNGESANDTAHDREANTEQAPPSNGDGSAGGESASSEDASAIADEGAGEWRTTVSLIGEYKYSDDFEHYDYVNPDAPVGGTLNEIAIGFYDSFNPFIVRGTSAAGLPNFGGGFLYDTLFEQSPDEASTSHAMIAEAMRYPPDYSSVTYRLDPDAKWHDGTPITTDDVIWSFETLKELHPQWNAYYRNIENAEVTGEREVTFTFDETGNRELPQIVGDLTVLPKHYWESADENGNQRDITQPTTEPPLGSGPYRIGGYQIGQSVDWERVPDYWGWDKPTRVGRYNFDRIDYTYFRDQNAAWEAFKKGGLEDYRIENSSQRWAEGYNFPAAENGNVTKATILDGSVSSMQAYVLNNRLEKFQDRRVRKALTLIYNFQEMNRTLFYGLYQRQDSYFDNSELAATGLPSERELKFLEPLRGDIPEEVFTEEFILPDYSETDARTYLREALSLFQEAGYELQGNRLIDGETGQQVSIEMLGSDPRDSRTLEPYARDLRRLGIDATIRIVDSNQYVERMRNFDFEMVGMRYYPQSLSPGNEQRDYFSAQAADSPGSRNYAGIKNEAVDALINDIVYAENREDLVAAVRAMDRVMLWEYYVIPQWNKAEIWLAYWDKFGIPEDGPDYAGIDPFSWWTKSAAEKQAANAGSAEGATAN
ncbi:peptide ABC transporter, periplasmic peptide-binding protein [Fulvimarina pelagi HTCC2506]|uniref:Peptide ABC transporter, periplasmic peptide-binding protein n=2 Tax=Fulvimarina pelagi TaxID=217511 RepID=Q0G7R0_9HYPH|nr:peptide ABC transporter, periplasmic peptide-binding protein [Fulvimarina pelagi HTCC2506]